MRYLKRAASIALYAVLGTSVLLNILLVCDYHVDIGGADETPSSEHTAAPAGQPALGRGTWYRVQSRVGRQNSDISEDERSELASLGYLAGVNPVPQKTGVTHYEPGRTYGGWNLYTSGHGAEAILMDMEGNIRHKWHKELTSVLPDYVHTGDTDDNLYWRRVYLYDNGDLLAIFEGIVLIKLDKDSNVLWIYTGHPHHDLFVTDEGLIYVLTREERIKTRYQRRRPIIEDFITILDQNGNELKRISVLESLENSPYAPILRTRAPGSDILHTNTLELLDGRLADRSPVFRKGNILTSLCHVNLIGVIDPERERFEWALSGLWFRQHQPTVLDNGHLLVFDNLGEDRQSRVLELDPLSQEITWTYSGTAEHPFFSERCGSSARLPNGNTLITESYGGRAFEVAPDGHIVWEFVNPHRAGEKEEYIAAIYELIRIDEGDTSGWLSE